MAIKRLEKDTAGSLAQFLRLGVKVNICFSVHGSFFSLYASLYRNQQPSKILKFMCFSLGKYLVWKASKDDTYVNPGVTGRRALQPVFSGGKC